MSWKRREIEIDTSDGAALVEVDLVITRRGRVDDLDVLSGVYVETGEAVPRSVLDALFLVIDVAAQESVDEDRAQARLDEAA